MKPNRAVIIILAGLFLSTGLSAGVVSKDVFVIKRNKNRNLVQYAVKYDSDSCKPAGEEPAHVYWRNLEEGPNNTSEIKFYEKPAYGIDSQSVKGDRLFVKLEALSGRTISISFSKGSGGCSIYPRVQINGSWQLFQEVYVFAKEGMFMPTVKWIEIRGKDGAGKPVTERINKD